MDDIRFREKNRRVYPHDIGTCPECGQAGEVRCTLVRSSPDDEDIASDALVGGVIALDSVQGSQDVVQRGRK